MYIELMIRRENGHLCHVDEAVADLLGWTAEEIKGKLLTDLMTPSSCAEVRRSYIHGPPGYGIRRLALDAYHKDGHIVPVHLWAACHYDDKGALIEAWGSIRHVPRQRDQDRLMSWWSGAEPESLDALIHTAEMIYAAL